MPLHNIDAATVKAWMERDEAVLIDVREPAEHAAEKIDGATLVPLSAVNLDALPSHTGKRLVLHCRSGKRSTTACHKLLSEDAGLDIYNLEGGITAWNAAGLAVTQTGPSILPLDRQVQLAIGLLLVCGSVIGYLGSPAWFLLTGGIGAGLMVAGLTGFCGLALVMAKMPWNQRYGAATSCSLR